MPAVLRDVELTRAWTLAADRKSLVGPNQGEKVDVAIGDWHSGRFWIEPVAGAWQVADATTWRGALFTGTRRISRQRRVIEDLGPQPIPIEDGDILVLSLAAVVLFRLEPEDIAPPTLEPVAAARSLLDAARVTMDLGLAEPAARLARRLGECRVPEFLESLVESARAAALEPGGIPARRVGAVSVLGEAGRFLPEAVRPLRSALSDPDREVRIVAVRALARIGGSHVVDALLAALEDVDDAVFLTALGAIERAREASYRPALLELRGRTQASKRKDHLRRVLEDLES